MFFRNFKLALGRPRFLQRDRRLSASDATRVEKRLAAARLLLAGCSLVAVRVDALDPPRYATLAGGLLALYTLYSLVVFAFLPFERRHPAVFRWTVHALDFFWPALLTTFSNGPNSPLFLFFLFGLMAAAYRWGFTATMLSGAAASVILLIEAVVLTSPGWYLIAGEFEANRFIIRSSYMLVIGFLLGYLAEDEKRIRAQESAISRVTSRLEATRSLRANLESLFDEFLEMFGCRRALLTVRERLTERLFLWSGDRVEESNEVMLHLSELAAEDARLYFFVPEGHAWLGRRPASQHGSQAQPDAGLSLVALDAAGQHSEVRSPFPPAFAAAQPFESAMGVCLRVGEEWDGALILFDPRPGAPPETTLRFLQILARRLSSAAYNVYLLRRLRSRAGATERARVARELHDGILQSLIALEMQVDVLRRKESGQLAQELGPLQQLLHNEILSVRELMQAMRPVEIQPHQFLDFAAETVQRFGRETGIAARFMSELDEVWLSPRTARELARILQEALVNVRKHARARSVLVRFGAEGGRWKLSIEDDGCGFAFAGRLCHNELAQIRGGPAIIIERLRAIQGELVIESHPGEGARLEISLPHKAYG